MQSVDFFTPVVDDPFIFGQIAASNALSDLYAVGATPLTALSLVAFPLNLGQDVLATVLRGGAERVAAAGAVIAGGHSVEDSEPKYGMAVTGIVEIDRMMTATACRVGDRLLLTKPLGCGILAAALKGEMLDAEGMQTAVTGMIELNAAAAEACLACGVRAATDVTGFGLLGHALEMATAAQVRFQLDTTALPPYPQVAEMAELGLLPAGLHRNRKYYLPQAEQSGEMSALALDLLCDPQTSGGLLISVAAADLPCLQAEFAARGVAAFEVGQVVAGGVGVTLVQEL